jgi:signal transduction histidine kinase
MSRPPIERLRLNLTAWYVGTFCIILLVLGAGLFFVIRRQLSAQLDDSLHNATTELVRAARIRETESASARGQVVDAVDELHIPDRQLLLLTAAGAPVKPPTASDWIRSAAVRARKVGRVEEDHELPNEKILRLYAEPFMLANGDSLVAVAVADKVELEDRYAALIGVFTAAALAAVFLVAIGGSVLVGKSAKPVEQAMDQMRRFMADAAHELRTPLTVLRSRAEIALQQPREPETYVSALRGVESESIRLGRIVEDLLILARADAGERLFERRRFVLDDVVLDAVATAGALAQSKQISILVGDCNECIVQGDPGLVRQLVMILLDNAIKFTPPGGTIHVRVLSEDDRSTLIVQDEGAGIPADQLPRVFDRFYRGDPARARGEGAGLGLSIARWIADAHDAPVEITSSENVGTRVEVRFPESVDGHAAPSREARSL